MSEGLRQRVAAGLTGLTYRGVAAVAATAGIPWWLIRDGGWSGAAAERYGFPAAATAAAADFAGSLWFHAASVGEVGVLARVLPSLAGLTPDLPVVVSTVTGTGRERARQLLSDHVHRVFLPLDARGCVRRTVRSLNPQVLVIAETEIWPHLITETDRYGAALMLVNGRLSQRAWRRYRRVRSAVSRVLGRFDVFCVKSEEDAERFIDLGAPPGRVHVTGDLKSEPLAGVMAASPEERRNALGLPAGVPVLVAGSTREGEEPLLLETFSRLREEHHDLMLVLVPRYPHRAEAVAQLVREAGWPIALRTRPRDQEERPVVLVVDTIGELEQFYAAATAAFVGGSLVPTGGHNLLEPARYGIPVLFGPHTDETGGADRLLLEAGGARRVSDPAGLAATLALWLSDETVRQAVGEAARAAVASSRGALERVTDHYRRLMGLSRVEVRRDRTDRGSRGIRDEDLPASREIGR